MSVKFDLKRENIEVIEQIDTLKVNSIANNIADRIIKAFPGFYLDKNDIFSKLSKLNMYKAKMPEGLAEACYSYKNSSIYFNSEISDDDLEEFAIHECIHHLQEKKNKRNKLTRMGISYLNGSKLLGVGLNEAAVQYMTAKIIGIKPSFEKYYGINIHTPSPSYYPLECTLLNELHYFVNEDILLRSTFFSNNNFKKYIVIYTSKSVYTQIETAFDSLLDIEEQLIYLNNELLSLKDGDKKTSKLQSKIDKCKEDIVHTFFQTQNLIIKNFFDYEFNEIDTIEKLEIFRKKLYKFTDIMGGMKDYTFFDNYYIEMLNRIDHKFNIIENGGIETAIAIKPSNPLLIFLERLKNLFNNNTSSIPSKKEAIK